jgi:predicted dehydrogenase
MSLRALVVGLGQIGMGYDLSEDPEKYILTHSRAFQIHPSFELIGGVDSSSSRLDIFEAEYSCPGYRDLSTALIELQPDIVAISVPTILHHHVTTLVLKNSKPKAILCEKPLDYDFERASRLVDDCRNQDVSLYVNYIRRADKGVADIKQRISNGFISQPIKGICWYSKGIINNGSHFLNLLQYWLGEVTSFQVIDPGRLWNNQDPEPDVKVKFELGTVFFLAAREEDYSHYTIELITRSGRLQYESGGDKILWQPVVDDSICEGYRVLSSISESIPSNLDRIQLHIVDQLSASLEGAKALICEGREALKTLEIINQIVKSL